MPVGRPGGPEDEKGTAKQRLQRLIRDFAHDAVGPGLEVEAQCPGMASTHADGILEVRLRLDRRLSRIELWAMNATEPNIQGKEALLKLPLQQVTAITKRASNELGMGDTSEATPSEAVNSEANSRGATLVLSRRSTSNAVVPELRLTFDTPTARDRAYTCLRIFQMSVDQSLDGQSRDEEGSEGA